MKPKTTDLIIRLLAIPVGLMGIFVLVTSLQFFYGLIIDSTFEGWEDILTMLFFGLFLGPLFLSFGGIAIYIAFVIWQQITTSRIRCLAALYAITLWTQLGILVDSLFDDVLASPDSLRYGIDIGLIVVAVSFYLILSRGLIARSSIGPEPPKPISRGLVKLFCFVVWIYLSNVVIELVDTDLGSNNHLLSLIGIIAPIFAVLLLYKAIIHFADRRYHRHMQSQPKVLSFT